MHLLIKRDILGFQEVYTLITNLRRLGFFLLFGANNNTSIIMVLSADNLQKVTIAPRNKMVS